MRCWTSEGDTTDGSGVCLLSCFSLKGEDGKPLKNLRGLCEPVLVGLLGILCLCRLLADEAPDLERVTWVGMGVSLEGAD